MLRETYTDAILKHGGLPVLLPEVLDEETARCYMEQLDALLLSGGGDIEASRFGEEKLPESGEPDLQRDASEILLTCLAYEAKMPVFGICRGLQVLNVALGGSIYQDIPVQLGISGSAHRQEMAGDRVHHRVNFKSDGLFASIIGSDSMMTNSLHHQSIKNIADALIAEGYTEDGIVEAVSGRDFPAVLGVQFHPELLTAESEAADALFGYFVRQACEYRNRKEVR